MRRAVIRSAQVVLPSVKNDVSPRAPFVCAACRKAASGPSLFPRSPWRSIATILPRQQQQQQQQQSPSNPTQSSPQNNQSPSHSTSSPQHQQNHYTLFPQTFPLGPPPHSPFTPDVRHLRKEYLQLQAKAHPDLAGSTRQAEALSTRINEAYKTLRDPLSRAQYLLLSLHDTDVEDETAKLGDSSELLMEVMEAREAVEEVEDEEELATLRKENQERMDRSVEVLEAAFGAGEVEVAAREAVRLRYWRNIEESILGWEKGKGGGVLHH